jgi:predicted small integral membrane protein
LSFASAKSGILTFLQLLQLGISIMSLQLLWYFVFSSVSAIWYLRSVSAILFWSDILSSASAKSGISTFLQLLQLGISIMSLQLLWYFVFSLVSAIWYLRSVSAILFWSDILSFASPKSGISTFLQLLQLGIFVMSLQLLWYFVFSSVSAIWYLRSVSAILFWSDILSFASEKSGISTFLQLLQLGISVMSLQLFWYFVFSSVSAI